MGRRPPPWRAPPWRHLRPPNGLARRLVAAVPRRSHRGRDPSSLQLALRGHLMLVAVRCIATRRWLATPHAPPSYPAMCHTLTWARVAPSLAVLCSPSCRSPVEPRAVARSGLMVPSPPTASRRPRRPRPSSRCATNVFPHVYTDAQPSSLDSPRWAP